MFAGSRHSRHAAFTRKVSNAYEHGAAAVIFVNDDFDIQKNLASRASRWQAAVDEIAEENAKFKEIEKPTADASKPTRKRIAKLAEDVKKFGDELAKATRLRCCPSTGAGNDESEGRNFPVLVLHPRGGCDR